MVQLQSVLFITPYGNSTLTAQGKWEDVQKGTCVWICIYSMHECANTPCEHTDILSNCFTQSFKWFKHPDLWTSTRFWKHANCHIYEPRLTWGHRRHSFAQSAQGLGSSSYACSSSAHRCGNKTGSHYCTYTCMYASTKKHVVNHELEIQISQDLPGQRACEHKATCNLMTVKKQP